MADKKRVDAVLGFPTTGYKEISLYAWTNNFCITIKLFIILCCFIFFTRYQIEHVNSGQLEDVKMYVCKSVSKLKIFAPKLSFLKKAAKPELAAAHKSPTAPKIIFITYA